MKKSLGICIAIGVIFTILIFCLPSLRPFDTDYPYKIIQSVNLVDEMEQDSLSTEWFLDNYVELREGKKLVNPYGEGKIIYKLKSSMGNHTTLFFGSRSQIESEKCKAYNKLIQICKDLEELNSKTCIK